MRRKHERTEHGGVPFKTLSAGEPSAEVLLLGVHVFITIQTEAELLSIVFVRSEIW